MYVMHALDRPSRTLVRFW